QLLGTFFICAGCAVASAILIDPEAVLGLLGKDLTLTGRTELWGIVVPMILERPVLGVGFRATWVATDPLTQYIDYLSGNWGATSAHTCYLDVALELGAIGLISVLLLIGTALRRMIWAARRGAPPLALFLLIMVATVAVGGLVIETLAQN